MTCFSDQLAAWNAELENQSPYLILQWAVQTFAPRLAVVTSFQPTGIITLHLLQSLAPQTPILTLDTDLLFPETLAVMAEVQQRFQLNLVQVRPGLSLNEQTRLYGENLWEHNSDLCCHLRKVLPLGAALAPYTAWVTGLRRDQTNRAATPIVSWDKKYNKIKLCPFANWTEEMVWTYLSSYDLPYNRLHDQGYPSIGCRPLACTRPVQDGADARSGRWANEEKTECGIHTSDDAPLQILSQTA